MKFKCKLCQSEDTEEVCEIRTESIVFLNKKMLGIDLNSVGCAPKVKSLLLLKCNNCQLQQFFPDWIGTPAYYEELQKFPWYYLENKDEFLIAKRYAKKNDYILEVGCGSGNFHQHLPDGIKYLGLEFNDRAIQKARARGLDVRSLPLEDVARDMPACFDLICAFQVLEHVPNPRQFLMDMVTSLKTGGVILFSVPSENSFLQYEVNNLTNIPPHHSTRWPDNTFKKLTDILNVDLVSVIHEDLSYADRRAYAKTQVWRIISFFTPLGRNKISPIATQIWFRFLVLFASLPFSLHLFIVKKLPPGHTVTVTLKKR